MNPNQLDVKQKLRKPIDQKLKRQIENLRLKTTVTLMLTPKLVELLDKERKNHFKTRSDTIEYFSEKGFNSNQPLNWILEPDRTKVTVSSVLLSPSTVNRFNEAKKLHGCSRSDVAEYYLRHGLENEGVI